MRLLKISACNGPQIGMIDVSCPSSFSISVEKAGLSQVIQRVV